MLYVILDCETATLPFVKEWELSPKDKQKISLAKPLIYDIGWTVMDDAGEILKKVSYLVQETFFVPNVFNTAYYRDKRPQYMEKLRNGEISVKLWEDIAKELLADCQHVDFVAAYNAMFDFVKAIPFTERYFAALYSGNYNNWEYGQRKRCEEIINNPAASREPAGADMENFLFRGYSFPMIDLWNVACVQLVNKMAYKTACARFPMVSNSGRYFKTSAEAVFRFLIDDYDFNEAHTALDDALIESKIFYAAIQLGQPIEAGIKPFPFEQLGTTCDFLSFMMDEHPEIIPSDAVANVLDIMESYCDTVEDIYSNTFAAHLMKEIRILENKFNSLYGSRPVYCPDFELVKEYRRKVRVFEHTKKTETRKELTKEIAELAKKINAMHGGAEFVPYTVEIKITEQRPEVPTRRDLTAKNMKEYAAQHDGLDWYRELVEKNKTVKTAKNGRKVASVKYGTVKDEFLRYFFGMND